MRKIYYLGTCSTCQRIMKDIRAPENGFEQQEIKTDPITALQLDELKQVAGSYEALFSRRSLKYRQMGLQDKQLKEMDYRNLILKEYTFLKRPVILLNKEIFIGSTKKGIDALKQHIKSKKIPR